MVKRTVKADASWSGAGGGGILGPSDGGLGFGSGSQGIGHSTNLPPGFGGSTGSGTWSGSVITDERFNDRVGMETIMEWDIEKLINKIRALIKVGTPDSLVYARELKDILDKRMYDLRRARRQFELVKTAEKHTIIKYLKEDPFVRAMFAEHNLDIEELDRLNDLPPTDHYALHDLAHKLQKTGKEMWELIPRQKFEEDLPEEVYKLYGSAWHDMLYGDIRDAWTKFEELVRLYPEYKDHRAIQVLEGNLRDRFYEKYHTAQTTQQPIKGKCPESGAVRYMSISDLVQHDYKAPCPEGPRRLEKVKSVSIEEYKKHKSKKKKSKKHKKASTDMDAMKRFFEERTAKHIDLTKKYLDKLEGHYPHKFDEKHDESKYEEPEYEPYLYITWKHKFEDGDEEYEIPEEWVDRCHEATFHHIKNNKHHPEYWDDTLVDNPVNKEDRDEPSGKLIDATKMPDKHILEMVADWCAMSEEKGNTPKGWADKNIGVRWEFSPEQKELIYEAIDAVWDGKKVEGFCKTAADLGPLPLDAKWYSPDSGFSRVWMVSEAGNRAFWKIKGDWRQVDGEYWALGRVISPQHKSVKEIRELFYGQEPWSMSEGSIKGFVRVAQETETEVEGYTPPALYSRPLPREFKWDYDFTKQAVDNLERAVKNGPVRVVFQYQDQAYRGLDKLRTLNRQWWPKAYEDYERLHPDIEALQNKIYTLEEAATDLINRSEKDVQLVKQLAGKPDELKRFLEKMKEEKGEEWVDQMLEAAAPHLPEMGTGPEIIGRHQEFFSTEDLNRPFTMQDFYDFYAASLSMGLLESIKLPEGWAEPARDMVLETVNSFGDKLVRTAKDAGARELSHVLGSSFTFKPTAEGRYKSFLDRVQQLEKQYTTLEDFNKLRSERKLALEEMAEIYNSGEWGPGFGGRAWGNIMKEAAELQEMLPVTVDNLGPVIAKIDHIVDLEHNTQLFLDRYVDIEGYKGGRLEQFLSEKTNEWDLKTFKEHSPKFYNLYKNLQRYARAKRFTKVAKYTITFTPEEQKIIDIVANAAKELGIKCYLVGGAVRDRLLGKENVDLDFMCEKDAEKLVAYLANKYKTRDPVQYDRSKALMLTLGDQALDFINAEKLFTPLKQQESLEGEEEFTTSFDDAFRRDLTINSLMYDIITGELLDPTGKGLKDLQEKKLNTIIDPFIKYKIHATDMLRAIRFAVTLGFELGPDMLEAMKENAQRVQPRDVGGDISNRRVRRELRKAIDKPEHWARMLELLQQAGLDIVLAKDIEDVQQDFVGGIDYHFDDEKGAKAMRIRRFTKQAGIFDMFQSKKKDDGGITPTKGKERLGYLTKKLDELLRHTPSEKHEQTVNDFLSSYMQLTPHDKDEILRNLNWYRGSKSKIQILPTPPEPTKLRYKPGTSDEWMD